MNTGKLYLMAAFILAGTSVIAAGFVTTYLPPFTTTFLSLTFASLTAVIFCGKKMYLTARRLPKELWIVILLQALFGSFLFRIFLTLGLNYIGAAEAGIITGATPAITAMLTWIMLHECLTARTASGIMMTIGGILLVQGVPFAVTFNEWNPIGVILVTGSAACESLFTTLSRKIHVGMKSEEMPEPVVHAGYVSILAMMLCIVPALLESPWAAVAKLPVSGWLALIWYGSIVTVVAFACMFAGAKRCDGYTIAAFAGTIPITSTILSVVVLRETIYYYQIAGCILIVLATLVISGANGRKINVL